MKNNIINLAVKLHENKWLLGPSYHTNLVKQVDSYLKNPTSFRRAETPEWNSSNLTPSTEVEGGTYTAIIPVNGVLIKGCSPEEEEDFGLTNIDNIAAALYDAINDPSVEDILMVFNTPGGEVTGIEELGRKIQSYKTQKPIFGWTETMCCSAGYWLMSQCTHLGMSPSAQIANVGVYSLILDETKALEEQGMKVEAFYSGKYKMMGQSFRSMTDEERAIMQEGVVAQHGKFKAAILANRQVPDDAMEGLCYDGEQAKQLNLVDVVVDSADSYLTITQKEVTMKILKNKSEGQVAQLATVAPAVIEVKAESAPEVKPEDNASLPGVPMDEKGEVCCPKCKASFAVLAEDEPKKDEPKEVEATVAPAAAAPEVKVEATVATATPEVVALSWKAALGMKEPQLSPFAKAAREFVAKLK